MASSIDRRGAVALLGLFAAMLVTECKSDASGPSAAPNPVPVLTSLSRDSITVGSASFQLTALGADLRPSTTLLWNGVALPTQASDSAHLAATIAASMMSAPESVTITAATPGPGGGLSAPLPFLVLAPVPVIDSLGRDTATVGEGGLRLDVYGRAFEPTSIVLVKGTVHPTIYISATHLEATLYVTDLSSAGVDTVLVRTPGPGAPTSAAALIQVLARPAITGTIPTTITATFSGASFRIRGSRLTPQSQVIYAGLSVRTTFIDDSTLEAFIPLDSLAVGNPEILRVQYASDPSDTTHAIVVTVHDPVPTESSITPDTVVWGDTSATIVVRGSGFLPDRNQGYGSSIRWEGVGLPATVDSATELRFHPKSPYIILEGGVHNLEVYNKAGGGPSNPFAITMTHPVPLVTSVGPTVDSVHGIVNIGVVAARFDSSATIYVNGTARPTATDHVGGFYSQVTAQDVSGPAALWITLREPAPGGGISDSSLLSVVPANPVPHVDSLGTRTITVGAVSTTLTLYGHGFVPGSWALWSPGDALSVRDSVATQFIDSTMMKATLPDSAAALARHIVMFVESPSPVASPSDTVGLDVWSAGMISVTSVPLAPSQVASDTVHGLIYAAFLTGAGGPRVAALSATTGAEVGSATLPRDPSALAISADDAHLYVALAGTDTLLRLALPSLATERAIGLHRNVDSTNEVVIALASIPAHPLSVGAILQASSFVGLPPSSRAIVVDDTTRRPWASALSMIPWALAFDEFGDTAYALSTGTSSADYVPMTVSDSGLSEDSVRHGTAPPWTYPTGLQVADGNIFVTGGPVFNAATGAAVADLSVGWPAMGDPLVEPARHRVYFGTVGDGSSGLNGTAHIVIADSRTAVQVGKAEFYIGSAQIQRLNRVGVDGLTFVGGGRLWIVRSSAIGP